MTGEVLAKNDEVEVNPGLINLSPMEDGWLFKIKVKNQDELKDLMSEEQYNKFLKSQQDDMQE